MDLILAASKPFWERHHRPSRRLLRKANFSQRRFVIVLVFPLDSPCGLPERLNKDVTEVDAERFDPGDDVRGTCGRGGVSFRGGPIILSNVGDRPDNSPRSR